MLFIKAVLAFSTLVLLAFAQEPVDAVHKTLTPGLSRTPTTTSKVMSRSLDKRCSGSCEECFGAGYTLCPASSLYCYLPGDANYGLDSCPGSSSGSSGTASASAAASTSTGTSGTDDICYQTGATCASCFGPSYLACPDGVHCYDPSDPLYNTCPDDGSSSSGGGGGTGSSSTSTCESQFGSGSVPCGTDACYNPDEGDVCCEDGYHCEDGYTCSSTVGKCCAPGSTSDSCSSASGSGGLGGAVVSSSSYSTALATSGDSFETATSTDGILAPTSSTRPATSTPAGSAQTGASQFVGGSSGGRLGNAEVLLVVAGLGALVL